MDKEQMTLCIPRVETSISRDFIFDVLGKMKVGLISKLTEVPIKNQEGYKRIIFNIKWIVNDKSNDMRKLISSSGTINLVYSMPWFWKVSEYKKK